MDNSVAKLSFGFFVALGGKSSAAHGAKFAGELKEPCALGSPAAVPRCLETHPEHDGTAAAKIPQNGRWFARDRGRRTPRLRQQREIADEPRRPDDPRRDGAIAGGIHRDRSGDHHEPVIGNFVAAKQHVAGAQNACFGRKAINRSASGSITANAGMRANLPMSSSNPIPGVPPGRKPLKGSAYSRPPR